MTKSSILVCALAFSIYVGWMLPPLLNHQECFIPEYEENPELERESRLSSNDYMVHNGQLKGGSFLYTHVNAFYTIALPAFFLTSRIDVQRPCQLWARRYAV